MAISCPTCGSSVHLDGPAREAGRFVRCPHCGTQWLARALAHDPYRREGDRPTTRLSGEISDAIVIEDAPKVPVRTVPPIVAKGRALMAMPATPPRRALAFGPALRIGAIGLTAIIGIMLLRAPLGDAWAGLNPAAAAAGSLEFRAVKSETVSIGAAKTLVVEGEIVNTTGRAIDLPRVRIGLTAKDGSDVTSWLVQPGAARLDPGQSIGFRSARASPPAQATRVTLTFAE